MFNPFAGLKLMPKLFKRMASGEVLASGETTANFGLSRLRLTAKREAGSGEVYAVLTTISSGTRQHFHLSARELDEFANIARVVAVGGERGQGLGRFRRVGGAARRGAPGELGGERAASPRRIGQGRRTAQGVFSRSGFSSRPFLSCC